MAEKRPKRRKDKDNPYTLIIENSNYYISFADDRGAKHYVQVTKEVFDLFNALELEDLRYMNVVDRHIEHSEVYDETLYTRMRQTVENTEDIVLRDLLYQDLYIAISGLPEIQRRRLILYYFAGFTYNKIAEIEDCSFRAVAQSIASALKTLKKILR